MALPWSESLRSCCALRRLCYGEGFSPETLSAGCSDIGCASAPFSLPWGSPSWGTCALNKEQLVNQPRVVGWDAGGRRTCRTVPCSPTFDALHRAAPSCRQTPPGAACISDGMHEWRHA